MRKALIITSFLILIPYISAQGQETEQEPYTSVDFNNNPKQYCSIQITDTPYKPT